jgi:hypothetical protein
MGSVDEEHPDNDKKITRKSQTMRIGMPSSTQAKKPVGFLTKWCHRFGPDATRMRLPEAGVAVTRHIPNVTPSPGEHEKRGGDEGWALRDDSFRADGRTMVPTLLSAWRRLVAGRCIAQHQGVEFYPFIMVRNEAPPVQAALPLRGVPFEVLPSAWQISPLHAQAAHVLAAK